MSAALIPWNMVEITKRSGAEPSYRHWLPVAAAVIFLPVLPGCDRPAPSVAKPSETGVTGPAHEARPDGNRDLMSRLVAARVGDANAALSQSRPDHALLLLVSALEIDPTHEPARSLAATVLARTVWNFPEISLHHGMRVERMSFGPPSSLWLGLGGKANTIIRWNLETLELESILFPSPDTATRGMIPGPAHRSIVIQRGGVNLLCDGLTLKPIRDLGPIPEALTPSAVIVFSPDGLLMAQPGYVSEQDRSIVWNLRDCASGQVIRVSPPAAPSSPQPLAAYLDREKLRVLHADGSLMEMPVTPLEQVTLPSPHPVKLLHGQFSLDGNAVLVLQDEGPHASPEPSIIAYSEHDDGSLKADALARRFPWSAGPGLWSGLMRGDPHPPFAVEASLLKILHGDHAPVEASHPISCSAFSGNQVIVGDEAGDVTLHRLLPCPLGVKGDVPSTSGEDMPLAALKSFAAVLAGCRYDETGGAFSALSAKERLAALEGCDLEEMRGIFPELDFGSLLKEIRTLTHRTAEGSSLLPFHERLRRADPAAAPDPGAVKMVELFGTGDSGAILTAISTVGEKGPAAAKALALALESENPVWIEASLQAAKDLPPLVRNIAVSRIAWLQGRKVDALASWPEIFPTVAETRAREDWDGWEQVDFQPALDGIRECVKGELALLEVPPDSTPEQRKAVVDRLDDPATVEAVGKPRFAEACLKAAMAFSSHKEETEATFRFASLARNLGAAPEPCLRAEALALTAQGDYQNAHPRWIELITEHPVGTHLPGDYAEAAYTAFENMDPRQAMEILTTGMHRFPNDGNFAMRAGWVALLTGNSERAYRFLREGQRIGFPPDKLENATALLVIAAAQSGANDDAAVYFQDLLRIDPAWADPATLETLDWPEELEASLFSFTTLMPDP